MGQSHSSAVAIFIYRRGVLAEGVMEAIRRAKPGRLWIIADGPKGVREEKEVVDCRQRVESGIDWGCEIRKVYSPINLGLRQRMETGLDAVFAQEEQAILLEEDCHPEPDFFPFCRSMLERYREEPRVAGISGNCFLPATARVSTDYFFSRYLHIWGWATWARAWQGYDRSQWSWPFGGFQSFFPGTRQDETNYWNRIFKRVGSGEIDTWDYRWLSHLWSEGQVTITPGQNLVQNRGFGSGATHTVDPSVEVGIERNGRLHPPYRGPTKIEADSGLDRMVFLNHFLRTEGRLPLLPRLFRSLKKRLGLV
jgi:adhesin HecA-like repeat protein